MSCFTDNEKFCVDLPFCTDPINTICWPCPIPKKEEEEEEVIVEDEGDVGESGPFHIRPSQFPEATTLTKEMMRKGLSRVARTPDTFMFHYSKYEGRNKGLLNVDILQEYVHLRFIDLSGNKLTSFKCLEPIQYLLVLVVSNNEVKSLTEIPELPFLQALSLKANDLSSTEGLFENTLIYLQLSYNKITKLTDFSPRNYSFLNVLEVRGNGLMSLQGLNVPTLTTLYVAENKLTNLDGLEECVNLTTLHARDNRISRLDNFPRFDQLTYVNLRENDLKRYTQTKKLARARNLQTLILIDNPVTDFDDYTIEMFATNANLKRLDKSFITEAEEAQSRSIRGMREATRGEDEDDDEPFSPPRDSSSELNSGSTTPFYRDENDKDDYEVPPGMIQDYNYEEQAKYPPPPPSVDETEDPTTDDG